MVLEGGSNRFVTISANTIETAGSYGIELRSARHSVLCGNTLDGGGLDLKATGIGNNPPAHVINNIVAANLVLGGRPDQSVYLGTTRPKDVTSHNLISDNLIQSRAGGYGIQAGNARFNQISGNHISRVSIGVVLDAPDTMVSDNSIYTSMHGIYASNFGLREFIHGNYLLGSNGRGSSGVFLNQNYTDAYVADNEERNFAQWDVVSVSPSSSFAYSSRYCLSLQPLTAEPGLKPSNSPGTLYMNSTLPGKALMATDSKGAWHPMW
jgi:hypothetical protein